MDIINETTSTLGKNPNFFSYITTFEDEHKYDLMNMFQYALLIMIPVILLNKGIGGIFSSTTEDKSTLEVAFELVSELCLLLSGIYMVHRLACYVPTYSEKPYTPFSFIGFVLAFIVIIFNFDTNLRAKFDYVYDNVYDIINGKLKSSSVETVKQNTITSSSANVKLQPQQQPQQQKPQQQTVNTPEYVKKHTIQNINQGNTQSVSSVVNNAYSQGLNENLYEFPQQFPDTSNTETFNPEPFSGF